MSLPLINQR